MRRVGNIAAITLGLASSAAFACLPDQLACESDHSGMADMTEAGEPAIVTTELSGGFAGAGEASAPPPPSVSPTVVHVFNNNYSINPSGQPIVDASIVAGEAIQWQWDAGFHSVTSVAGSPEVYNSGAGFGLPPFDHTFPDAGVYTYFCTVHGVDNGNGTAGGMAGTITVSAVPEPALLSGVVPMMLLVRRRRS